MFKAALSGGFKEASERSMSLPEDDRDSVGRMIQWLYTKKFNLVDAVDEHTSDEHFLQLAKLNTLAEKYDIYLLRNDIVDALFDFLNGEAPFWLGRSTVQYLYDNTTKASTFRKLTVAWYVYGIHLEWYEHDTIRDQLASVPQECAIDLAIAFAVRLEHLDRQSPFELPSSDFHEKPPKEAEQDHAQEGIVKEADQS